MVVAVGETDCDPLTATPAPFRVALTALVEVHVSVELPPDAIEVFALIPAVGALEPTVTVAWAVAVTPDELVATKRYVVVAVGETDCDPLTATAAPFRVALTALVEVHVSVELPPDAIEVGFALIPAVGALEPTVTVAWAVAVAPDELVATVIRGRRSGRNRLRPIDRKTAAPFRVALTALVEVHVSVELPPDAIEVGFALIPAVERSKSP